MAVEGGFQQAVVASDHGALGEQQVEMLVKAFGAGQLGDRQQVRGGEAAEEAQVGLELAQLGGIGVAVRLRRLHQTEQGVLNICGGRGVKITKPNPSSLLELYP